MLPPFSSSTSIVGMPNVKWFRKSEHYFQQQSWQDENMRGLSNSQFMSHLKKHGIEVHAKDGRLQINAPVGAVDLQLRAELVRRKVELLAALQHADFSPPHIPLVPAERNGGIPQTHAQQGMWLIDHFDPGNVAYNIPEAFVLEGAVDREVLQKAINSLVARHETLRTYFYEEDGDLFQAVSPEVEALAGFTDLSTHTEEDRERTLQELIRKEGQRPFDLRRPPLVRFHLFRMAEQRNVIFFNIHHIISDRRSLTILREELMVLYQAAAKNEAAGLPELCVQYGDYAIWVEKYLKGAKIEKQVQYWKRKLAEAPAFLELPCSRPYPEKRTAWGATVPVTAAASVRDALIAIGNEEGASLYMTLLAAFAVLLHQQTGCEDFCIGSPFTHRKLVETESIIGLFVNMLVLRCELGGEPSFREILRRVRDTALEAYENSDVPFQKLVRVLKTDMRSRRSALFQIMFAFDAAAPKGPGSAGMLQMDTRPGTARYDLTLQLGDGDDGIFGTFEYCTDLFDEAAIVQLGKQYTEILHEVIWRPDQSISDMKIASGSAH